ncbi:SDR family NAD(P)-dependent oxidoreductase [Chitinophaga pendula]|uniref:oxidoreductase n=1 Tax=Chitinophaga TaxID=79328 RepID=UPI000BB026FB|nr:MULTISPECIES: oxidoreductase [Chitinophaga]ASZ12640.1 short-chain dehydrogenase/reductase [Chitinophaga sp. MD30]UCJ09750.1 SDR family NAD(P)-dependent oxidoreductase [Chitinophaga pendula]
MQQQKVWFITGASKGFGFEITKAALAAGHKVAATVRTKADQVKAALGNNPDLEIVQLDVTDKPAIEKGVQQAINRFGRIDVLVNNAGYGLLAAVEEATDAEMHRQFDTNVFGLLNVTRAVLPFMRSQQTGHIINIASLFAYGINVPGLGLYAATKYTVEGISEALDLELRSLGIRVTSAAPGLFRTEFLASDSYVNTSNPLPAYDATVGQTRNNTTFYHGNQPGDPAKLAQVILLAANSDNPPVHLPIGPDAIALFRDKTASKEAEIAAWEKITSDTNFTTTAHV